MEITKYEEMYDADANIMEVGVEITRSIRVGQSYKIGPTEAYLGIDSGTVRVLHIGDLSSVMEYSDEVSMMADEFAGVHLSLMDEPLRTEEDERLRNQPWIVYQYTNKDVYVLPLEEFVIHTTMY